MLSTAPNQICLSTYQIFGFLSSWVRSLLHCQGKFFNRLRLTGSKGIKLDNTYICYVDDLECYCTDRGLEIVGDCSPTIRGGNYGAGNATYGAIYISTRAGKTSISGSYLESQANPTVVANGCLDSAIFIYDYYDENATTGCIKSNRFHKQSI